MSNGQAEFERVNREIIDPIKRHYGCQFDADTISDYVDDLGRYKKETLQSAMEIVRREQKRRPALATVIEACKQAMQGQSRQSTSSAEEYYASLKKRDSDAVDMAASFQEQFKQSQLYLNACKEKYDVKLLEYVYQSALLQARFITKAANPGYNQNVLTNNINLDGDIVKNRIREFVEYCRKQASTGVIDTQVPHYLIDEWKQEVSWREQRKKEPAKSTYVPTPEKPKEKTALDLEIERQLAQRALHSLAKHAENNHIN